jgi:leader peptidase (prepilin peptidase)/N-methyltransferase
MTWYLDTALATAGIGFAAGLAVPELVGRIPEPRSDDEVVDEADTTATGELHPGPVVKQPETVVDEPKELYASIATLPGLRWRTAAASAVAAGLIGARTGWTEELLFLLYLVPVGVALALVDWRTRLLPTKVIAPSYVVVAALCVLAAAMSGEWDDLERAGWGWAVGGGTFLVLWLIYPRGMGYGDVRLSGVLGIALGYLGWGPLLVGVYAGFLLGGVGGTLLTVLRIVDRKAYPFGPFMLLGALVGILWGGAVSDFYVGSG